jgi:hypothetical protein
MWVFHHLGAVMGSVQSLHNMHSALIIMLATHGQCGRIVSGSAKYDHAQRTAHVQQLCLYIYYLLT